MLRVFSPPGRSRLWWIIGLFAICILLWLSWPRPWLVIRHEGDPRWAFPGEAGTRFTLRWMHSVEKEDWEEWFQVQSNGSIIITGTRFKTFGAGVPAHAGKETHLKAGWVVMTGIDRVVDPLAVQAAMAEHYRLIYDGHTLMLSRHNPPPILTFSVEHASVWSLLPALIRPWWAFEPRAAL